MLSYHNDPEFKAQLVDAARAHRLADEYVAGTYQDDSASEFRGCSVGCSLHDVQKLRGVEVRDYGDHGQLAEALGVPEWLTRLQDQIFEGLSAGDREAWTERLYAAIPVGVDISHVKHELAIRRLRRLVVAQERARDEMSDDEWGVKSAIATVVSALEQTISAHEIASHDTESAAWSAESAAWSVAHRAEADDLIALLEQMQEVSS